MFVRPQKTRARGVEFETKILHLRRGQWISFRRPPTIYCWWLVQLRYPWRNVSIPFDWRESRDLFRREAISDGCFYSVTTSIQRPHQNRRGRAVHRRLVGGVIVNVIVINCFALERGERVRLHD